jgi:hypothetical protein
VMAVSRRSNSALAIASASMIPSVMCEVWHATGQPASGAAGGLPLLPRRLVQAVLVTALDRREEVHLFRRQLACLLDHSRHPLAMRAQHLPGRQFPRHGQGLAPEPPVLRPQPGHSLYVSQSLLVRAACLYNRGRLTR